MTYYILDNWNNTDPMLSKSDKALDEIVLETQQDEEFCGHDHRRYIFDEDMLMVVVLWGDRNGEGDYVVVGARNVYDWNLREDIPPLEVSNG